MTPEKMNPAAGDTADGVRKGSPSSRPSDHSTARKAHKASLTVRLEDRLLTVHGRVAQTLALLIQRGALGFTSGEASPLAWARRTSHYIHRLRREGFLILTSREAVGDALVGRYTLACQVEVMGKDAKTE